MIQIFLEDYLDGNVYEIRISSQLSFFDIMQFLRKEQNCKNLIVYEKTQNQRCDPDISLNMLNIVDGMYFVVL